MNDILVIDTDALSVLAKAELVDDLLQSYSDADIVITPKVETEIEIPLTYGYEFPNKILKEKGIDIISLSDDEKELYRKWFDQGRVGKGELESMAVAKRRGGMFFTMDRTAAEVAKNKGIDTIAFNTVMKHMLEDGVIDRKEVEQAIKKIEERDNRKIDKSRIFPS